MLDAIGGIESIVVTGGALLANPDWVQVLADVLGRPLEVSAVAEGSARGAALVALERLGLPRRRRRSRTSSSRARTGTKSTGSQRRNNSMMIERMEAR